MSDFTKKVFYDYADFIVIDAKGRLCIYWQHGFHEVIGLIEYNPPTTAPSGAWVISHDRVI